MARKRGWRRIGSRGHFRYVDARGNAITGDDQLERIRALVIPPAWQNVWISPSATAKLQATGVDAAGRRQYLYHADFRAQQEQAKFDRLIRFAERLPDLRAAMVEHMDHDALDRLRVSAIATRLINRGWLSVVTELLELPGGPHLFRYEWEVNLCNLAGARLNDYVRVQLGEEFTAKDFRTWGGTLIAAIALAERG